MADDFKVSTKATKPGDQPLSGKGGLLPVYGTQKVQDMRARTLARAEMEKAINKPASPTTSRSMSKR